jgi:hypothetical protein
MDSLLGVDLGLKTGLALFRQDGRLLWYRSHNFGKAHRLRRGVFTLMNSIPDLVWLVLEGGGPVAEIWEREAKRRDIPVSRINAEEWRKQLLYPREQRTGLQAKHSAKDLARRVIELLGASRPTSLRHDAAEAILIGLWAALRKGWLDHLPIELRHHMKG